jgi:hypothetical protein
MENVGSEEICDGGKRVGIGKSGVEEGSMKETADAVGDVETDRGGGVAVKEEKGGIHGSRGVGESVLGEAFDGVQGDEAAAFGFGFRESARVVEVVTMEGGAVVRVGDVQVRRGLLSGASNYCGFGDFRDEETEREGSVGQRDIGSVGQFYAQMAERFGGGWSTGEKEGGGRQQGEE